MSPQTFIGLLLAVALTMALLVWAIEHNVRQHNREWAPPVEPRPMQMDPPPVKQRSLSRRIKLAQGKLSSHELDQVRMEILDLEWEMNDDDDGWKYGK